MRSLTPKRIVEELDKYVIGQKEAKRCVAIAIRNRWRRQQLSPEIREDVLPKNIIMIGPTGVGKTEIARRLSQLINAPFLKVEASKYTEVGYHGRDVESMVRELVDVAINIKKAGMRAEVETQAKERAEQRLVDLLAESTNLSRADVQSNLRQGRMENIQIEVPVERTAAPFMEIAGAGGMQQVGVDFQKMFEKFMPKKKSTKSMKVTDARQVLTSEEAEKLIDDEKAVSEGLKQAENSGIIFIDELDKICGPGYTQTPEVSREGVQRDLLPIVEGSTVSTRHGLVHTDHILFIAAGAFHTSKITDLIPELQGRFPLRVELSELTQEDLGRIMTEPKNSLTKQYAALLETEGVELIFTPEAVKELARIATELNSTSQNIGARRLYTIFEKLLEDPLYEAPETQDRRVYVAAEFAQEKLKGILQDEDLRQFVL